MSKFKKLAVCGLAGVMALGVGGSLVACGGGNGKTDPDRYGGMEKPATQTVDVSKNITLRVNTMFGFGDPHETAYGELRNDFSSANSKISIADSSGNPTGTNWQNNLVQDMIAGQKEAANGWGNAPDVIFFFSGSNTDPIKDCLMTVEEIKAIDATYGNNLVVKDSNPYSLGIKQGGLAMFYNTSKTDADALSSWTKLEEMYAGANGAKLTSANRSTLPHYMLAPILADEMGLDAYAVVNGQTTWTGDATNDLANNKISKDKFASAMLASVKRMRKMGFTNEGGNENGSQLTGGTAAYHVDGNWWASNVDEYKKGGEGQFVAGVKAFPGVKTTEGGSETKVVNFGGSTTGWMITKAALARGTDNVKAAIAFVKQMSSDWACNAFCVDGGGAPTTGKALMGANYGMAEMQKVMNQADMSVIALDDRIPAEAKGALLSTWSKDAGLPKLLAQSSEPTLQEVKDLLASTFYAYYDVAQGGTKA